MGNLHIENQFITGILENKITIQDILKTNFDASFLDYNAEMYEWITDYYQKNDNLPSIELVTTRYPAFQMTEIKDDPFEIIEGLRRSSEVDRYINTLNKSGMILQKTGNVQSSRNYLQSELEKFDEDSEQDVFDLSTDEDANRLLEYYKLRYEMVQKYGQVGIPTGFGVELDTWFNGGLQKGNLYGVLAPLGVGKTWTSMVMGGAAMLSGNSPFMLFLEGNLEKEGYRSLTVGTSISNSGLHAGALAIAEVEAAIEFFKRKAKSNNSHYYLALHGNRSAYTPNVLRSKLVKHKPKVAIVDYLALMGLKTGDRLVEEWQVYSFISKELKKMAVSFDIPIVATLQGNRNSNDKDELSAVDSSFYNLQRDFDGIIGMSRVKGKKYVVRLSGVKGRDSKEPEFKALYRTNWDEGKVVFEGYVEDGSVF